MTEKSNRHSFDLIDEADLNAVVATIDADDLAWAKPYVDQARSSVARGDVLSGEEYFKRLNAKLEALRFE